MCSFLFQRRGVKMEGENEWTREEEGRWKHMSKRDEKKLNKRADAGNLGIFRGIMVEAGRHDKDGFNERKLG